MLKLFEDKVNDLTPEKKIEAYFLILEKEQENAALELHKTRLDYMKDRAAYFLDKEQNETGHYQKCQYFKMFTMYENMIIEEKEKYANS